jgi:predicted amidohydrolase
MQPSCWLMKRSDAHWQEYGSHRSVPNAALTVGAAACGE